MKIKLKLRCDQKGTILVDTTQDEVQRLVEHKDSIQTKKIVMFLKALDMLVEEFNVRENE